MITLIILWIFTEKIPYNDAVMFGNIDQNGTIGNSVSQVLSFSAAHPMVYTSVAVVAGAIFKLLYPPLAVPFFGIAAGSMVSMLIMGGLNQIESKHTLYLREKASTLTDRYPKLQLIAFISTLALSCFSSYISAAAAVILGILKSTVFEVKLCSKLQEDMKSGYSTSPSPFKTVKSY